MALEFRLLGGVEARDGDRLIDTGHARQRCVLAGLLVDANRVVPSRQLVERAWGDERLPARPLGALQTYISLLRRSVAANGQAVIVRQGSGYMMTVAPEAVDLHRFRQLAERARAADGGEAAALFEEALALWRGEPFAGLDTPWIDAMRVTLAGQRLAVLGDLIDVQLRRGRHGAVAGELAGLVAEHPLDERLAGQYMAALHGSGRQADALAHYQEIRRRLAGELGCDPGAALRRLHQRILDGDPALAVSLVPAARGSAGAGGRGQALPVVPRQLPADVPGFTGRTAYLAELDLLLAAGAGDPTGGEPAGAAVAAVMGAPGVGKTALAVNWAHRVAGQFPDGQLYVNLRGFDPDGQVMDPGEALRGFCESLGVPRERVPAGLDAQAALYRSLLSGRRVLVVLDNAYDSRQVRWLLPGTPACPVVVTSRNLLSDLLAEGARPVALGVLPAPEARILLSRRLGADRVSADLPSAAKIVARCAGLPLALSKVAARAAIQPGLPLHALAAELTDQLGAPAGETPDSGARAASSRSYHDADRI